jgi:hypothetical protein
MVVIGNCTVSLKRRMNRLLGSRIEMHWSRPAAAEPVIGETEWIEQVILDMALRARTALPFGGRLAIEIATLDLDELCAETEGLVAGRYLMLEMTCLRAGAVVGAVDALAVPLQCEPDEWVESWLPRSREILQSRGGNNCE